MMKAIIANQILEENGISRSEIISAVKDALKNDSSVNKDLEKKVRELVASSVNTLFRTLWQRRNFYEDEIKRG
jgi:hypothetical protein